ncbi:MAG TPA: hypothetical protein H9811_03595 [Candidatus Gemmiger excrementigallinarum]|uniref:Phage tail tape measure protein n=1 Tax=Candidatus Gemmiger excrementigallinarum TaxID=2838609 RepID=A0A9D2J9I7_9FIRM|nr:hypothetical protein [Candidatus Gemmiger excrementigallinarum]
MADVGEVRYKVTVDDSGIENDQKKVEDKLGKGGKSAGAQFAEGFKAGIDPTKATNSKVADAVTDKWKTASAVVGASFAAMTAGAVAFGVKSIGLASDLNEVQNVVDTTFGDSADQVNKWAESAGEAFGLSELSAKQYTSTLGAMLKSMGMSEDATTEMSIALAGLAGDMASFYNLDPAEAFEKLRSGISGETEPLKQLGINMSVANLEAFALENGLLDVAEGSNELKQAQEELSIKQMKLNELQEKGTASASQIASAQLAVEKAQDKVNDSMTASFDSLDAATQAEIRYQYIMQATADAQGDFSKTSDSLANQQRILQMEVETLSADLGQALLPAALSVVEGLRSLVEWASQNQTALTVLAVAFAGITAAIIAYSASLTLAASGMTIATAAGAAFGAVVGFLTSPITLVIAAITALVAAGVLLYQNWDTVSAWAASAWESIKQSISSAIEAVSAFISNLAASASAKMSGVRDAIVNGFNSAVEFITSLPAKAKQWGSDFVQGLIDGITSMARNVADAAKGLADKIAGFLHFSRPDVGPLREYETWMPDMVRGLAAGIRANEPELESAADSMAGKVSGKIKRGIASAAQWADFASGINIPGPLSPGLSWSSLTGRLDAAGVFSHDSTRMEGLRQALTITPTIAKPGGAFIEVPVSIDGREVARATAWYMGEQLAWEER